MGILRFFMLIGLALFMMVSPVWATTPVDPDLPLKMVITSDGKGNITASIENAVEAEGTWTYEVDDNEPIVHQSNGIKDEVNVEHLFSPMVPTVKLNVTVHFEGTVNRNEGVKVTGNATLEMKVIHHEYKMTYQYKLENCKHKISAEIHGAKKVMPSWELEIVDQNDKSVNYKGKNSSEKMTYSAEIDLLPVGKYQVFVRTAPDSTIIDDKPGYAGVNFQIEVTEKDVNVCKTPQPKPQPPAKPPVKPPTTGTGTGGPLPNTATSYPTASLFALGIIFIGVNIMSISRKKMEY